MPTNDLTRGAALNKASAAASATIKERYIDEWNVEMEKEAKALGQDWKPRLTPEQRAEADLAKILAEHPDLAAKVAAGQVTTAG